MADEHVDEEWVRVLRQRGHEVAWVVEDAPTDWPGHFSVIEEGRIRMIPLAST